MRQKMKKINLILTALALMSLTACTFSYDADRRAVLFADSDNEIEKYVRECDKNNMFEKRFTCQDYYNNVYVFTIYNREIMKINNIIYTYEYKNVMLQSLVLLDHNFDALFSPHTIGLHGIATPVNDKGSTVSFVYCQEMFPRQRFKTRHDAESYNNISFMKTEDIFTEEDGYINDFGEWHSYDVYDLVDIVLASRSRDIAYIPFDNRYFCSFEVKQE